MMSWCSAFLQENESLTRHLAPEIEFIDTNLTIYGEKLFFWPKIVSFPTYFSHFKQQEKLSFP